MLRQSAAQRRWAAFKRGAGWLAFGLLALYLAVRVVRLAWGSP